MDKKKENKASHWGFRCITLTASWNTASLEHMKKRTKQQPKDFGDFLRIRISPQLKQRLVTIASKRKAPPGQGSVSVSDVAREYLLKAAEESA